MLIVNTMNTSTVNYMSTNGTDEWLNATGNTTRLVLNPAQQGQRITAAVCLPIRILPMLFYAQFILSLCSKSARNTIGTMVFWYIGLGVADLWFLLSRLVMDMELIMQLPWSPLAELLQTIFYWYICLVPYYAVHYQQMFMSILRLLIVVQPIKYRKLEQSFSLKLIASAWLMSLAVNTFGWCHPRVRSTFDWRIYSSRKLSPKPMFGIVVAIGLLSMLITLVCYTAVSILIGKKATSAVEPTSQHPTRLTTQAGAGTSQAAETVGQSRSQNNRSKSQKTALKIGWYLVLCGVTHVTGHFVYFNFIHHHLAIEPMVMSIMDVLLFASNPVVFRNMSDTIAKAVPYPKYFKFMACKKVP